MPKVHPIRVFDIPSDSRPGEKYKVQFDGSRWFCECRSWVLNVEHRGEKDDEGRAVPRECKHTRLALSRFQQDPQGRRGTFRTITPIGPWFEELQEYVASLVDMARNGQIAPEKFRAFHADLGRFKEEREKVSEALGSVDTMISVYGSLLKQLASAL